MLCEKGNNRNVKQNDGFLFKERLKWLHRSYKVLLHVTGRSINQSSKKCFWKENNEIMILRNITWIYSLTWIRVTWKFTYSTFSKANMKNCNYNHHSKQSSPNTNWIKLFGELLNLTIKNNCYWTKIYCASSFFFSNIA